MENVSNISSEEELLQLRNEGKISETEYEELREAIQKTPTPDIRSEVPETNKAKSKRKLGITAFVLMLAGIVLPVVCILLLSVVGWFPGLYFLGLWLFLGVVLEIAALGIGIAAWADPFGKAATICPPVCVFLLIIVSLFSLAPVFVRAKRPYQITVKQAGLPRTAIAHKHYRLDGLDEIITRTGVEFDNKISSDGNGSVKISVTEPTVIRLFETGYINIENARLIYEADIKTENVTEEVYLEMWCCFAGKGKFFSRGLDSTATDTEPWKRLRTAFFLKPGESPDNVKLNLVVNGSGTVWVDNISLLSAPHY